MMFSRTSRDVLLNLSAGFGLNSKQKLPVRRGVPAYRQKKTSHGNALPHDASTNVKSLKVFRMSCYSISVPSPPELPPGSSSEGAASLDGLVVVYDTSPSISDSFLEG